MPRLFFCLLIVSLLSCKNNANKTPENAESGIQSIIDFSPNSNKSVMVSAHRGGGVDMKGWPENCLETMQHLYSKGVRIFEVDVLETFDSELILMHDNSLDRTTTGKGEVAIKEWNEMKDLKLKDDFGTVSDFQIPKLSEVLDWAKETKVYLTLDLKDVDYGLVVNEIRKNNAEANCALIAYSTRQSEALFELAPEMMLSVPMRNFEEVQAMLDTGIPTANMIAFTGTRRSAPGLNQRINDLGIMVIFGTLGNIDKSAAARGDKIYSEFIDQGVQILATDRPLVVQELVNSINP